MNVQTHMSAGQVPNQGGLPQQNGNVLPPNQLQNIAGGVSTAAGIAGGGGGVTQQHKMFNVDHDLLRARRYMHDRILGMLLHRHTQPLDESQRTKFRDISKRLEEGLFKAALTKEDYMNMDTLEHRLSCLIKGRPGNNNNQRHRQLVNSSSSIDTMIPTPGMSHSVNSSLVVTSVDSSIIAASGGNTIAPITVNSGSLLSTGRIQSNSYDKSDGTLSNGYQQSPANFSLGSGGNLPSMGVQRIASQMIPTPGFNSNSNQNNSGSNQSYMNLESSNNDGGFLAVETSMVSQPQQQKQHVGGQNSRIMHNLGSHMGSGIRSGLQHKSYGFSNGVLNGGIGMIANNLLVNEPGTSEGYLTGTQYANSPKPLQQHFDHQRSLMQGDGYGMSNADSYGTGNCYGAITPVGSMTKTPNMNSASFQSMPISKTSATLMGNQSNLHSAMQVTQVKAPSSDQSEKIFHSPLSSRDNLLQSHQQQEFQQQAHHAQQQQQFVQHQRQQKLQSLQQQHLLNNDDYGHYQVMSNMISQVKSEPEIHSKFQLTETQNQFELTSLEDHSRGSQHLSVSHQLVAESHNGFNCISIGAQSESAPQGRWHSHSQEKTHMTRNMSHEQHIQEDFRLRIAAQGEAQPNNLSFT